jgi:hypothetical protein
LKSLNVSVNHRLIAKSAQKSDDFRTLERQMELFQFELWSIIRMQIVAFMAVRTVYSQLSSRSVYYSIGTLTLQEPPENPSKRGFSGGFDAFMELFY